MSMENQIKNITPIEDQRRQSGADENVDIDQHGSPRKLYKNNDLTSVYESGEEHRKRMEEEVDQKE